MNKEPVSVFWFRRDLRLDDNHGLYQALNSSHSVLPVFIFDQDILEKLEDKEDKRVDFIYQTLAHINQQLIENGSSLLILHSTPLAAFQTIVNNYLVKEVYTNGDYEPYAIKRDQEIQDFLKSQGIGFHICKDQVIFEKNDVLKADQTPYTIFTPYSKQWKASLQTHDLYNYKSAQLIQNFIKQAPLAFPSMAELGFKVTGQEFPSPSLHPSIISNYHNTRNLPYLTGTSQLSIHLRFGTMSVRKLVKTAIELNEQWLNELIWREFFMMILYHFPYVVTKSFKTKYEHIQWRNNEAEFKAWCNGETGYPIVDAGMRELNETGLMHNRVRMIVASFLTKDLLVDWRWGEAYFAEKLLDYDLSANNGNWQWAAGCGCDAAPYFRIFNPTEQTKKFDPDMIYIKKWIKDFDNYLITPIVEHDFARKRCLNVYKAGIGAID